MFLYHYSLFSNGKYDVLKSKSVQGITEVGVGKYIGDRHGFNYNDHISAFIEKAPLDIIAGCFDHKNDFWKSGNVLYEYEIDPVTIDLNFFVPTELPIVTKALYDKRITDDEYDKIELSLQRKYYTLEEMLDFMRSLKGETRKKYMEMKHREGFERIVNKYAATVPHLLIIPKNGIIKYRSASIVNVR